MSLCSQPSISGSRLSLSPTPSKNFTSQSKIQPFSKGGNTLRVPTMQVASPRSLENRNLMMRPSTQQIEVFKYGQLFQIQVEAAQGKANFIK